MAEKIMDCGHPESARRCIVPRWDIWACGGCLDAHQPQMYQWAPFTQCVDPELEYITKDRRVALESEILDLQQRLTAAEREAETARAKAIEEVKEAIRVQRWAFKNPDARNGLLAALQAVYELERRDSKAAPGAKEEANG